MRIIILVLSSNQEHYGNLMVKQQNTWDSIYFENIKTIYYYGSSNNNSNLIKIKDNSFEYECGCSDDYKFMHYKFYLTLKLIKNEEYDFIFRTNSSSYIDKKNLLKFAESLPKNNCYCGIEANPHDPLKNYVSGSGFLLSKDCVDKILVSEFYQHEVEYEDMYIGKLLYNNGIEVTKGALRSCIYTNTINLNETYHVRCKSDNKTDDLQKFDELYKIFRNNYDNR